MTNTLAIKITDSTLLQLDGLQDRLEAPSRSDVIRRTVGIIDYLAQAIANGERIFIEGLDSRREIFLK